MEDIVKTIGGQLAGLANKHMADYSFAAFVHSGEEVALYFFKGRLLERTTALAPGSATLGHFKDLQARTARKSGLFRKTPYLAARVCVRARGRALVAAMDYDDGARWAPQDEDKRRSFDRIMGEAFPDPAAQLFAEPLPGDLSPADRARRFMAEFKIWNDFAFAEDTHDDSEARWNQGQGYDTLILRHCGPEKKYQALAFGSEARHCPEQERVLSEEIDGAHAMVETLFQNAQHDFIRPRHSYEFTRAGDGAPWRLAEVWYHADEGERLPSL